MIELLTLIICAILWRMGGDSNRFFRNPLVPIVISLVKFITLDFNWWVFIYVPCLWAAIQLVSYGIDTPNHKFWKWLCGTGPITEVCTRATCGFFWSLPAIVFAILTGHWVSFGIYMVSLTIVNGLVGGLVTEVEVSERVIGATVASSTFI
jgi:hypothetical protein